MSFWTTSESGSGFIRSCPFLVHDGYARAGTHDQSMSLCRCRRLAPGRKRSDDVLGDRMLSTLVLGMDDGLRRFDVHDLDSGVIVGESVDPAPPCGPRQV